MARRPGSSVSVSNSTTDTSSGFPVRLVDGVARRLPKSQLQPRGTPPRQQRRISPHSTTMTFTAAGRLADHTFGRVVEAGGCGPCPLSGSRRSRPARMAENCFFRSSVKSCRDGDEFQNPRLRPDTRSVRQLPRPVRGRLRGGIWLRSSSPTCSSATFPIRHPLPQASAPSPTAQRRPSATGHTGTDILTGAGNWPISICE